MKTPKGEQGEVQTGKLENKKKSESCVGGRRGRREGSQRMTSSEMNDRS